MTTDYLAIKGKVYKHLVQMVETKKELLNKSFDESRNSLDSESKSTAGDKHETGRAMIQLEQEKMGRQLAETQKLEHLLLRVPYQKNCNQVETGALIETNKGYFFVSVGLGKVKIDNMDIVAIAPTAPIAQAMLGLTAASNFKLNGMEFSILRIH